MTTEAKVENGVSAELIRQWHEKYDALPFVPQRLTRQDFLMQEAYAKGLADGMEMAAEMCEDFAAADRAADAIRASIGRKQ